jgi:hypothetical protein
MATAGEPWYVRLPDGRTARARNSDVLRAFVRAGRIPPASQVRRSGDDEWLPLERVPALADALIADAAHHAGDGGVSGEAHALGIRGLIEELLNAVDRCRNPAKLTVAAMAGVVLGIGTIALDQIATPPSTAGTLAGYLAIALCMLAAVSLASVILTQTTVIELDRHRPARAAEVRRGLLRHTLRTFGTQAIVGALLIGLVLLLRAAAPWIGGHDLGDLNSIRDVLAAAIAVLRLVVEVVCWPIVVLALLLLGPVLVIEDAPALRGLREWLTMVRRHLSRIYLYEAMAFMFAIALSLPLLLLVGVIGFTSGEDFTRYDRISLSVLAGLALTPFLAYLMVANVFIYLNLRYEFFFSARER